MSPSRKAPFRKADSPGSITTGDRIGLIALLISVLTAGWQIAGYAIGPSIDLVPPTSVTFRYFPVGERETVALTATTMNYLNDGRKDYDGLVADEVAEVRFHGLAPIRLNWWWFVGPDGSAQEQAHPVVVPGGGLTAHETRFVPLIQPCNGEGPCTEEVSHANFMRWDRFLALGASDAARYPIDITFLVKVRERRDRTLTFKCKAWLDSRTRAAMSAQRKRLAELVAKKVSPAKIEEKENFYFSIPCMA